MYTLTQLSQTATNVGMSTNLFDSLWANLEREKAYKPPNDDNRHLEPFRDYKSVGYIQPSHLAVAPTQQWEKGPKEKSKVQRAKAALRGM